MSDANRDKLLSMMKSRLKNEKVPAKASRKVASKQNPVDDSTPPVPEGTVVIGLVNERQGKQLASMLLPLKLKSRVAANGSNAWNMIEQELPDCIVVDEELAYISGIAICEKVRMLPDGLMVPVLLVVSSGDKATKTQANDAGITDLIATPVVMVDLAKKIRQMVK